MLQFMLKNESAEVARLSQWINGPVAANLNLSSKQTFKVDLVLGEAVTNIIDHAFAPNTTHDITVLLQTDADNLTIQIIDDGKPFDPLADHDIVLPTTLEHAGYGGLGIHLIRSYTGACHYRRDNDKNIFTMIMSISE